MSVKVDTTPPRVPIFAYAGVAFHQAFGLRSDDGYIDTAGWTGTMRVKASKSDAVPTLDSEAGDILLTFGIQGDAPDQWNVEIYISDAVMSRVALRDFVGWYDVKVTDTSGRESGLFAGPFCVEEDIWT